jgi:hypothetical protein
MEQLLNEIEINGVKYYRELKNENITSQIKIVVLQRGNIVIGRFQRDGNQCKMYNAHVIRNWGTEHGLGQLTKGKTSKTILDKCYGVVEFDYLTVIMSIDCEESAWKNAL